HAGDLTHSLQPGDFLKGFDVQPTLRPWPVHHVQIEVVEAEFIQRRLKSFAHLLPAMVVVPDLAGNEKFIACDVAGSNGVIKSFAEGLLVLIQRGGIKVTVAKLDGLTDYFDAFVITKLVGTQANLWNLPLVIVRQRRNRDFYGFSRSNSYCVLN